MVSASILNVFPPPSPFFFITLRSSRNIKSKTNSTIILPVIFGGSETRCHTLEDVCRLRLLDNRVQRRTFRAKGDEIRRESRKLHNEEVYDLQIISPMR
jgi:hypothetical protein